MGNSSFQADVYLCLLSADITLVSMYSEVWRLTSESERIYRMHNM